MSTSDRANKIYKEAYTHTKQKFGSAWGLIPRELRVLYVQSAVLSRISAIDLDGIGEEGRARICEYIMEAAHKALLYNGGSSE